MRLPPSQLLLGPALVLYLVSAAVAVEGHLDALSVLCAGVATVLAIGPLWLRRCADQPGYRRVCLLGVAAAGLLLRSIAPSGGGLLLALASALSASSAGALLLDLSCSVPEAGLRPRVAPVWRGLCWAAAAISAACAMLEGPPARGVWARLDLPARGGLGFADLWLMAALWGACVLRLRLRRNEAPEARAANRWALLGLLPSALLLSAVAVAAARASGIGHALELRVALLSASSGLLFSHLRLIDPHARSGAGPAPRAALAAGVTLALLGLLVASTRSYWPADRFALAALAAATASFGFALQRGLRALSERWLAPGRGRLQSALSAARRELDSLGSLEDLARVVLRAARTGSAEASARPLLYVLNPPLAFRLDAAGFAYADAAPIEPELVRALRESGRVLPHAPPEADVVRRPALQRPLEVLAQLQASCAVPLVHQGELEAVLIVPQGRRTSPLSLEEIDALEAFAHRSAVLVALLCSEARAQQRALAAQLSERRAEAEAAQQDSRRGLALSALRAAGPIATRPQVEVAYSAAMREALQQLERLARDGAPVLLWAEPGVALEALARTLHAGSPHASGPFLEGNCTALARASVAPLLSDSEQAPALFRLAEAGTLFLGDLVALERGAQRALGELIAAESAMAAGAPRIVASCRRDPAQLALEGALDRELAAQFVAVRVPPLRERREDLPSLVLLALDRSARLLGRAAVGIEPDAHALLLQYDWPGNQTELESVIACAVARCRAARVSASDLPGLGVQSGPSGAGAPLSLDGTLEAIERCALVRALERTHGNKSEAARSLGLKRTTFLDKCRRHGLDGPPSSAVRSGTSY